MHYLVMSSALWSSRIPTYPFYLLILSTFTWRALEKFPSDPNKHCMTNQCVGINMLKNILLELSEKAGLEVHYTNHSLRATTITWMFNSGIPERVIAENSGHRSTKALRCYERTSQEQQQAATRVINSPGDDHAFQPEKELREGLKPCISSSSGALSECKPAVNTSNEPFAQFLGGVSGNFTNCIINISLKWLYFVIRTGPNSTYNV